MKCFILTYAPILENHAINKMHSDRGGVDGAEGADNVGYV